MHVAVIGAGAAAAGVLAGLREWGPDGLEVSLFDIGKTLGEPAPHLAAGFGEDDVAAIYDQLRAHKRFAFPPPKSHFGEMLPKYQVGDKPRLWRSEHHGGLTTIWGGGMFPFTDRELARWPIDAADLAPYYGLMANRVGVCGEATDRLGAYFGDDYVNRPALRTSPVIHKLIDTVNASGDPGADWDIVAGASRLALETRPDRDNQCTYLGECMLGCPRQAVWSAAREIDRELASGFISHHVRARVLRFEGSRLEIESGGGSDWVGPFDRIFVAAGCIGSTEIVMRSLGLESGPRMLDNAVLSFPILYGGAGLGGDTDEGYFSLCNASMAGVPRHADDATAQVSIYPSFDHLWRYYTPRPLWPVLRGAWRAGRWRFLLGRVFFAGSANRTFSFSMSGGALSVQADAPPDRGPIVASFMRSLRAATNHNGFSIGPVPPVGQATSSHYAGTFPYNGEVVPISRSGRIAPGVHIADATTWASAPAISPTFTIMANACRTAHEAVQE